MARNNSSDTHGLYSVAGALFTVLGLMTLIFFGGLMAGSHGKTIDIQVMAAQK